MERKFLSVSEIIKLFKKGVRNFSSIESPDGNFSNMNLSRAIFKNSNLSGADFEGANLTDCDFSGANLSWCSFQLANLTKTNFSNAMLSYSKFNDAIFNQTNFEKADVSYTLMFNVNRYNADFTNAIMTKIAWDISELQPEVHRRVEVAFRKTTLSAETKQSIKSELSTTSHLLNIIHGAGEKVSNFFRGLYSPKESKITEESPQRVYGKDLTTYGQQETVYTKKRKYSTK